MLVKRAVIGLILFPVCCWGIILGGWPFALGTTLILGVAAWEYWRMLTRGGFTPSLFLLVGGVVTMSIVQQLFSNPHNDFTFSLLVLAVMTISVYRYELGQDQPASNFSLSLTGLVYLGWLGSYLIPLRSLPDGVWWMAASLPAAWLGDVGAFLIGSQIGKHRLAPRVSPRKSWEGYFGGLPFAIAWSIAVAWFAQGQAPNITPLKGAILGLAIGLTAPLGDLFESLLKREFGVKDTSNILPGHGGVMDRIDSSLWTGVVSYYLITLFLL
jgi:phosphatidate cytidylyltransferase